MYVTQPRRHGEDLPHTVPPIRRPLFPQGFFLGNYHIRNVRVSRIAQAIRAAYIGGFDLMVLMDTNITDQYYCCNMIGYNVVYSKEIMVADGY